MEKIYDGDYVDALELRVKEQEHEIHVWQMNGVMLDLETRMALYERERERERKAMDDNDRRELERVDDLMAEAGL